MSKRCWYLRDPRNLLDAHLAQEMADGTTVVESLCGARFTPAAAFHAGSASPSAPPDPRVCATCQAAAS